MKASLLGNTISTKIYVSRYLGMEESGSEGLDELIQAEAGPGKFFEGVDCVCISDNYWLNDVTVSIGDSFLSIGANPSRSSPA